MKITKIETFLVNVGHRNWPLVKIHTDEGLYGVGESYSCGPDKATVEVIRDFEAWLIGRDPRDVEALRQLMVLGSRFPAGAIVSAAISGIEHALWDIAGKAAGVPVYRLLGGKCRDKIRVYGWAHGTTPAELADHARKVIETYGFSAVKMQPMPPDHYEKPWLRVLKETEARVSALREAVGDEVDIGLDLHARLFEPVRALELCQLLAPFRPLFVEEAIRPENFQALARLSRQVEVPLATGEQLYNLYQFRQLLRLGAVDIVQPDMCLTGIIETIKIAALAEGNYASVAPHNPCGPVATAVNVHVAASMNNFLILEYLPDDDPNRTAIVDEPIELVEGYLQIPEKPGLGIDLNEDALGQYPFKPWHRPFLFKEDGAISYQ
jgi:galactonate dehydratase